MTEKISVNKILITFIVAVSILVVATDSFARSYKKNNDSKEVEIPQMLQDWLNDECYPGKKRKDKKICDHVVKMCVEYENTELAVDCAASEHKEYGKKPIN